MAPRVSVVIPTYNRAHLLPAALESVFAQSYRDYEVIVVDDGSSDETATVVAGYGERIRFLPIERSGGPARPRNIGVARAEGELVAFLDSDDVWLPGMLEIQVARLDRDPAVALVCANARVMGLSESEPNGQYFEPGWELGESALHALIRANFVLTSSVVARRAALELVGGFSEEPLLAGVEDFDLWLRIAVGHELRYDPEPVVLYRRHPSSLSGAADLMTHWRARIRIFDRLAPDLAGNPSAVARLRAQRTESVEALARTTRAASRSWVHAAAREPGAVGTLARRYVRRRLVGVRRARA